MKTFISIVMLSLLVTGCDLQQVQQMEPTAIDFGDSVSLGYAAHARLALDKKVDFRHNAWKKGNIQPTDRPYFFGTAIANGHNDGYSTTLLAAMESELEHQNYTVVLYNSGIHDLQHDKNQPGAVRIDPDTYRNNLEAAAQEAQQHASIVIWVDTTDVDGSASVGNQYVDESGIVAYNAIADSIATAHGFYILHLPPAEHDGTVHFMAKGYAVLGQAIADCVLAALQQQETSSCHR